MRNSVLRDRFGTSGGHPADTMSRKRKELPHPSPTAGLEWGTRRRTMEHRPALAEPACTTCQARGSAVASSCSSVLRPLFPRSGSAVSVLKFVRPRRSCSNVSVGCVRVCALDQVETFFRARESFCGGNLHSAWCNFSSARRHQNSFLVEIHRNSPTYSALKNRPLETVFSLLTPPTRRAKVSSTCAAAPFAVPTSQQRACRGPREVRGSRIPACWICAGIGIAHCGRTSQPLAMLCATRGKLREARGPLQPMGCELPIRWGQRPAVHCQPHRMQRTARRLSWTQSGFVFVYFVAVRGRQDLCQSAQPMRFGRPRTGSGWTGEREHARSGTC